MFREYWIEIPSQLHRINNNLSIEEEGNMENIKDNSANKMESINNEENHASKMENIDTKKNLVSNKENVWTVKIPLGNVENIESAKNPSNYAENRDIKDNSFNNIQNYNTGDTIVDIEGISDTTEDMNGIISLISNQKKNTAFLLQILDTSTEIFESTFNFYNSTRGCFSSPNRQLSDCILRRLQRFSAVMGIAKSSLSDTYDELQCLDGFIKSIFKNSMCPIPIHKKRLMHVLRKFDLKTSNALCWLTDIAELCRLILTDDPTYLDFMLNMPILDSD